MKLALVASGYLPDRGALERHVHELAMGLTVRGVNVEVLTQDPRPRLPAVSEFDGFVVRRFVASFGNAHFAVAPGLWDHLRRTAASFDLVHAHSTHASLALAAARARPRRLVFTPHAPVQRLLRRPYGPMIRAVIGHRAQILCTAKAESEVLQRMFPWAADQIGVVPHGVDVAAIDAARPFAYPGTVVLTAGRLERHKRMDRAIAAMAALDPAFRLAVVGDGPAREKLLAHAADLRVASRVNFVGAVPDAEFYRWLRTARVVVALAELESSGIHVTEALCAGAQVVASDIPVHREAASYVAGARVVFVSPAGSPLDVADGIREAADLSVTETLRLHLPTWDETVERILAVYTTAIREIPRVAVARG
jgi:glycosyltransferase involved in cell wall biosynthesis